MYDMAWASETFRDIFMIYTLYTVSLDYKSQYTRINTILNLT